MCYQNVAAFHITMDHVMSVKVDESVTHFVQDVSYLLLFQAAVEFVFWGAACLFQVLNEIRHWSTLAKLHHKPYLIFLSRSSCKKIQKNIILHETTPSSKVTRNTNPLKWLIQSNPWKMFAADFQSSWPSRPKFFCGCNNKDFNTYEID